MNSANKNSHSCVRQLHNSKLHKIIMLNLDFAALFLCITWPNFFKTHFYQKSISDRQNDRHCDEIESPLCSCSNKWGPPQQKGVMGQNKIFEIFWWLCDHKPNLLESYFSVHSILIKSAKTKELFFFLLNIL